MRAMGTTREKYLQPEERKKKSLEGHRQILAALKGGSPDAARRAMRRHLQVVENMLFKKGRGGDGTDTDFGSRAARPRFAGQA